MEHTLQPHLHGINVFHIRDHLSAWLAFANFPWTANLPYVSGGTWYVNLPAGVFFSPIPLHEMTVKSKNMYPLLVDLLTLDCPGTKLSGGP